MRIVWAEDTESDRFLIETALGPGVDVAFAEDGRQAVELVRTHRPALTVLDLKMPRVGGIAALRSLRADPALARSRVVIFSSSHQSEEVDEARALGATAYVQKPIGFGPFQAAVRAIAALSSVPDGDERSGAADAAGGRLPAPAQHRVLLWESEDFLLEMVERFLAEGRRAGHGTIVLATQPHLAHLRQQSGDLWLDTEEVLQAICAGGDPDPQRFAAMFQDAFAKASLGGQRPVSCFGELVTVLHQRGHAAAAVAIEAVGQGAAHDLADRLSILCAYPLALVAKSPATFDQICSLHTHVDRPSDRQRRRAAELLTA